MRWFAVLALIVALGVPAAPVRAGKAQDAAAWLRDHWRAFALKMKAKWKAAGAWWKSCGVCGALPKLGRQPCRNVCEKHYAF